MERKAKRNCALSVRCRYVARQIHRSPGRGLLALLVAAVLLFGLCYLQESILSNQQEMERLYCTIEVCAKNVHLVDERHSWNIVCVSLTPYVL